MWNNSSKQTIEAAGHTDESPVISHEISEKAVGAAINFVSLCSQQTAYMARQMNIQEEINIGKASKYCSH